MRAILTSVLSIVILFTAACASTGVPPIDLSKLPPIVIAAPTGPAQTEAPKPAVKPRATLAFSVRNAADRSALSDVIITLGSIVRQTNADGYAAMELDQTDATLPAYQVSFDLPDFETVTRSFPLTENSQFTILMRSTKPVPAPAPVITPPPPSTTPPPAAPAPPPCSFFSTKDANCPAPDTTGWSDDQWKQAFFSLLKKHNAPRTCNLQTLNDTRADVEALGAEWQHTSGGELRPRLFLPTGDPTNPYGRAFDVGLYGQTWDWIKR